MGYSDGEALILTQVQACNNFDSTNTSRANWKLLNQGKDDHYAILRPGPFDIEWIAFDTYRANWVTVIEVWQRYKDDTDTHTSLYDRVEDLFDILGVPLLGDTTGTIQDSTISVQDEPEEMWMDGGGPAWLRWKINILWREESNAPMSITPTSATGYYLLDGLTTNTKVSGLDGVTSLNGNDDLLVIQSATSKNVDIGVLSAISNVTELSAACSASDTTISVRGLPKGIGNNLMWVVIDAPSIQCEVKKITGISNLTLTLDSALAYSHSAGDNIYFTYDGIIKPEWWGAVSYLEEPAGASYTDSGPAINAALNCRGDVSSYHMVIEFGPGWYKSNEKLLVKEGTVFRGQGPLHTKFYFLESTESLVDNARTDILIDRDDDGNTNENVTFEGFSIYDVDSGRALEIIIPGCFIRNCIFAAQIGIDAGEMTDGVIDNVGFDGGQYAIIIGKEGETGDRWERHSHCIITNTITYNVRESIKVYTIDDLIIDSCHFRGLSSGIVFQASEECTDVIISNCVFNPLPYADALSDYRHIISYGDIQNLTIADNTFVRSKSQSVWIEQGTIENIKIRGNTFEADGDISLKFDVGDRVDITGNTFIDSNERAIQYNVSGGNHIKIENNSFYDCNTSQTASEPIVYVGQVVDLEFNNNYMDCDDGAYGLYAYSVTNVYEDNNIYRGVTTPLYTNNNSSFYGVFTDGDTTPSVRNRKAFRTANTNATTITTFDEGYPGQLINVIIADGNTTIDFTDTNLKGNAGVDWSPASGDSLWCLFDGTNWHCHISDNTA
jgi:hypothetical protein